jgi:hypothetical protein
MDPWKEKHCSDCDHGNFTGNSVKHFVYLVRGKTIRAAVLIEEPYVKYVLKRKNLGFTLRPYNLWKVAPDVHSSSPELCLPSGALCKFFRSLP